VYVCIHDYVGVCVSQRRALPVAAAAQEPHDLPGSLILPLCEQTTSVKHQKENHVELFAEQKLHICEYVNVPVQTLNDLLNESSYPS